MSKSDPASKSERLRNVKWVITIFLVTILVSGVITFASDKIMATSGMVAAFLILFAIMLIGILFDTVGVAVTSADESPFHSMAARKVPGAQEAIRLLRKAERVSSICNDVIGDICGVISGSAAATISVQLIQNFTFNWPTVVSLLMSALVAGLTVGGKAASKGFAVNSSTEIVYFVGRAIYSLSKIPDLFCKKR